MGNYLYNTNGSIENEIGTEKLKEFYKKHSYRNDLNNKLSKQYARKVINEIVDHYKIKSDNHQKVKRKKKIEENKFFLFLLYQLIYSCAY